MSGVSIEVDDDPAQVCATLLSGAAAAGGNIVLTGGSTPRAAYEAVSHDGWGNAVLWFGDERCVPPDDERSNYRMVRETLLEPIRAAGGGEPVVHQIDGELGPHAGADAYEALLDEAGRPRFDLLLLGLGSDGHTFSLFPDQPTLFERARWVIGVEQAGLEPFVPRVSFTLATLEAARRVVFLVSGTGKADAVAAAFGAGAKPDPHVPASLVPEIADDVLVLLDSAAAAKLSSVIGVDIGGTKVAVAMLRERELGDSVMKPTDCSGSDALIDQIVEMVSSVREDDLEAVGLGVPSIVDFGTGEVISSVNVPLADVPLRQVLGERLGVPAFIDNDATVAALAEAHDKQLRLVANNLVMLTVGTGVGGGLVLGGRIYRGATGGAGELGHTVVGMDCAGAVPAPMGFPQPGTLEFVASGHALDRLASQAAGLHPESELGRLRAEGKPVLGAAAVSAAHDGDQAAARIIEIWGQRVGIGVANAINTFDPEEVVIGGGAAQAGDLLLEPAKRIAAQYMLPGLGRRTTIRLARHGVRAGVLGAALLARDELAGRSHPVSDKPSGNIPTPEVTR